jgi:hypothetical protein
MVCIEPYTKHNIHKEVSCPYCEFKACSQCWRQYLLGNLQDPHCMNCRRHWDRDIMCVQFPNSFVNQDYKNHREQVLYERERCRLPDTQSKIANIVRRRFLEKERRRLNDLLIESRKEAGNISKKIREITTEIHSIPHHTRITRAAETKSYQRTILRGCPKNDCRGFILTNGVCGVCYVKLCLNCHEIVGVGSPENNNNGAESSAAAAASAESTNATEHTCKQEDVETANLILTQTRPCPKCSVPIYKIDGCDQMFCTQCQTAFSWRTGEVELHRIHNPHYYEWIRQNGGQLPQREPGDIPCGGMPTLRSIRDWMGILIDPHLLRRQKNLPNSPLYHNFEILTHIHRGMAHIEYFEINTYRREMNRPNENEDLRVNFLLNEMSENDLKKELQQREKKKQKRQAIFMLYEMFLTTVSDTFRNHLNEPYNDDQFQHLMNELNQLRQYFNEQILRISKQFTCRVPILDTQWNTQKTDYKTGV